MSGDARIPKLTPRAEAASITTLPLGPTEGYVLSRVDGTSSEDDLSIGLGLPQDTVVDTLEKLALLGLVTFETYRRGKKPNGSSGPVMATTRRSSRKMAAAKSQSSSSLGAACRSSEPKVNGAEGRTGSDPKRASTPPPRRASSRRMARVSTPPVDTAQAKADSAPPGDETLGAEEKARIDAFLARCQTTDHYEVLGIERSADKKAVKRAYYELAAMFHPDRHFNSGRSVYRARMEEIFRRLTDAHDTLLDREKRKQFDGVSAPPDRPSIVVSPERGEANSTSQSTRRHVSERPNASGSQATSEGPNGAKRRSAPAEPSTQANASQANATQANASQASARLSTQAPPPNTTSPVPPVRVSIRPPGSIAPGATTAPPTSAKRPVGFPSSDPTTEVRKVSIPSGRDSVLPPSPGAQAAMDHFRRRYEAVAAQSDGQVKKYIDMAETALHANDPTSAANAYRIALTIAPNDEAAAKGLADAEHRALVASYDANVKKANDAEKMKDWPLAARHWVRACRAEKDEPTCYLRGAQALMRSNGDLREAAKLAKRAVELSPSDVETRTLLISIFIAAEMWKSAKIEIDRALEKWPKDDDLKSQLKAIKAHL